MAIQNLPTKRRVSASRRRTQMIAVAIAMAHESGVGALTLARVAEASGVSKPIAYQHFGTMPGLLRAMYEKLDTEYEDAVLSSMSVQAERGDDLVPLLRELCEAYITCSLESGALLDEIGAALISSEEAAHFCRMGSVDRYKDLVANLCGLDQGQAQCFTVAFLGAADRICEAIIAGQINRQDGVSTLVALFTPPLMVRS